MIEYRLLTEDDIPSLLELYIQLDEVNRGQTLEESREYWKEIQSNKSIKYFGAVDDGKVVASCWSAFMPNLTHHGRSICFIENVVTDSAYRRQGLGRRVIEMAVQDARENDCYMVCLLSNARRTEAHKFYEKLGFSGDAKRGFVMKFE